MPLVTITPLMLLVAGSTVTALVPLELKLEKRGFSWERVRKAEVLKGAWVTEVSLFFPHPAVRTTRVQNSISIPVKSLAPLPEVRVMFLSF
jgi:hypothetical protein